MTDEEMKETAEAEMEMAEEIADSETPEETEQEVQEESECEAADENAETDQDDAAEDEEGHEKKKGGFFKKKKDKKDEQIASLTEQVDVLKDQLLRSRAEFENYRNRTTKEMDVKFDLGVKNTIEKILPVIDNFERGLSGLSEEELAQPFAQGMDKTYKVLMKTLEDMGVSAIEAVGQPFNPDFHNAVMQEEAGEGTEANTVVEEYQKGYMYHGFVVRYSMVKVAI